MLPAVVAIEGGYWIGISKEQGTQAPAILSVLQGMTALQMRAGDRNDLRVPMAMPQEVPQGLP